MQETDPQLVATEYYDIKFVRINWKLHLETTITVVAHWLNV